MKLLLISDIHGRSGWMWLLNKYKKEVESADKVIFMGDYLDHYDGEIDPYHNKPIDSDSEFQNFKLILDYKRENNDKVILLLGNHDMEYISKLCVPCRMNFKHQQEISDLFLNNLDLFSCGFYTRHNDCLYTFSHANIMVDWMKAISPIFRKHFCAPINEYNFSSAEGIQDATEQVIDTLNSVCMWAGAFDSKSKDLDVRFLGEALQHVGPMRGGYDRFGSMVWADMQDYEDECMDLEEYEHIDLRNKIFQTVAHTQHLLKENEPLIQTDYLCCTDCHIGERGNRPLFLWEDGNITILK